MIDPLQDIGGNVFAWLCDEEREKDNEYEEREKDSEEYEKETLT